MQVHLSRGLAAAEAARQTLADDEADWTGNSAPSNVEKGRLKVQLERLQTALDRYDEATAEAVLDRLLDEFTVETVMREVLLPFLRELGGRWARGEAGVAQEHFASGLLRARLVSLTRGWGFGGGPVALLACAPAERHDLPLLMFGICLRRQGWRITYLGADTPLAEVAAAAQEVAPSLVVLAAEVAPPADITEGLSSLAKHWPVALAGRGADLNLAASAGVEVLRGDPVSAAFEVSSTVRRGR
jgi:methanogenic corrinoid protein MtbC1